MLLSWDGVKKIIAFSFITLTLGTSANAAQQSNYTTQTTLSARDSLDDSWKFEIAPYIWALNMNGSVGIRGRRAPVDQSFSDILNHLNWAGMIWLEADKGKFGMFLNLLYASLSDGASDRYISAHMNTNFGLYTAGFSYQIYKTCLCPGACRPGDPSFSLTPYVGARYTSNNLSLTINTPLGDIRRSDNQHWTDPIIGARFHFDLTKAWLLTLAGDVGGTNMSSDYSYNVWGLIGYKPQTMWKSTTWYAGYRLLDQRYSKGTSSNYFYWNMKLYGPIVGVGFTF